MAIQVCDEKCNGCRLCILACPEPNVIRLQQNKRVRIEVDRCKLCLLCVSVCPRKALANETE